MFYILQKITNVQENIGAYWFSWKAITKNLDGEEKTFFDKIIQEVEQDAKQFENCMKIKYL